MGKELSPKQIVAELDKYIIGQDKAKRAVANALRNRYRRNQISSSLREEITPKNIIMKGPTGVGKTEIARRLAKLVKAPFIKVEATKFTEVGYVGRDVESMIRDLAEAAARLVKDEQMKEMESKAKKDVEIRVANIIYDNRKNFKNKSIENATKDKILERLLKGEFDNELIEVDIMESQRQQEIIPGSGMAINLSEMFSGLMNQRKKKRKLSVKEAIRLLVLEECEKNLDKDNIANEAVRRAEQEGIIFIDEIDKIASKGANSGGGPDVSREGVQRDILPIVEGSSVMTKYGIIKTDYILFIASGAFHVSKMTDLIPELQGRFPIKVELDSLRYDDFLKILTLPENAITKQYSILLKVDNVNLKFTNDSLEEISRIAVLENETSEDIGARRLHTLMENLLDDISFHADGSQPLVDVVIDKRYVEKHLSIMLKKHDLKKYIL